MTILIFANGDIDEKEWLRPYLADARAVIAADGGVYHLLALDAMPDAVIGDLDSLAEDARARLEAAGVRFMVYPAAKDESDLELALLHAAEAYEDDILVLGAFGGRLDQTIANILLLAHPALAGRRVTLVGRFERAWLVTADTVMHGAAGDTVSLIPVGGDVAIRATTGLRWPLLDDVLAFGPARGLSNVMTADQATITVASGSLLCIHTRSR